MQELRLVAVSEDGTYLVLATAGRGTRFTLPVDDRLRAAVRGNFSRLGQYEIEVESPLRPKEIQARIRAGESAEEIAATAGIPVERVRWFEGPVLQEREYMAQQAQRVSVRMPGESAPGPTLGDLVAERLTRRGVPADEIDWDAAKRDDNLWRVKLGFVWNGHTRHAEWLFDPRRRNITPNDDEAMRLSAAEYVEPERDDTTVRPFVPRLASKLAPVAPLPGAAHGRVESDYDRPAVRHEPPARLDPPLRQEPPAWNEPAARHDTVRREPAPWPEPRHEEPPARPEPAPKPFRLPEPVIEADAPEELPAFKLPPSTLLGQNPPSHSPAAPTPLRPVAETRSPEPDVITGMSGVEDRVAPVQEAIPAAPPVHEPAEPAPSRQDASPQTAHDPTPQRTDASAVPADRAPAHLAADQAATDQAAADQATAERGTDGPAAAQQTVSEQTGPEQTTSGQTASETPAPESASPGEASRPETDSVQESAPAAGSSASDSSGADSSGAERATTEPVTAEEKPAVPDAAPASSPADPVAEETTATPATEIPASEAPAAEALANTSPAPPKAPAAETVTQPVPPAPEVTPAPPARREEPARPAAREAGRTGDQDAAGTNGKRPDPRTAAAAVAQAAKAPQKEPVKEPAKEPVKAAVKETPKDAKPETPAPPVPKPTPARPRKSRGRRASVPTWDEIMFGARKQD
ncbi:hypothetical protein Pth03_28760 [Planotetraspora thailandica]|uniref:DUF3071 domain-containing protein n=1 Tax=Planotetraspora thailandica TaxID=487172 RepID=A0A8J3XTL7_9ACTN|nr:septation protein SepH [Planotetraspora thailandica]GII54487.1 hypothetical protein Pth03_28760 [Planotetraspora thailandica]